MEAVARTRHVRISPQKLRLVCELIEGKKIDLALSVLEFTAKRSAKVVSKPLLAAVALAAVADWRVAASLNIAASVATVVLIYLLASEWFGQRAAMFAGLRAQPLRSSRLQLR